MGGARLAVIGCSLLASSLAWADAKLIPDLKPVPRPRPELRYDTAVDLSLSLAGGVAWLVSESRKGDAVGPSCRLCDRTVDGRDALNALDAAVRSGLRWDNHHLADTLSNITAFGLAPLAALGLDLLAAALDHRVREFPVDLLLILEATIAAADLNQAIKLTAGRERPFVHVLTDEGKRATAEPGDNNLSFFSGHSTLVFALAVSSGTVASMRRYRLAPLIWCVGLGVAALTGYLRIAADKHYVTDVLTGMVVGSAVGFAVPFFGHRPRKTAAVPSGIGALPLREGGAALMVSWRW